MTNACVVCQANSASDLVKLLMHYLITFLHIRQAYLVSLLTVCVCVCAVLIPGNDVRACMCATLSDPSEAASFYQFWSEYPTLPCRAVLCCPLLGLFAHTHTTACLPCFAIAGRFNVSGVALCLGCECTRRHCAGCFSRVCQTQCQIWHRGQIHPHVRVVCASLSLSLSLSPPPPLPHLHRTRHGGSTTTVKRVRHTLHRRARLHCERVLDEGGCMCACECVCVCLCVCVCI